MLTIRNRQTTKEIIYSIWKKCVSSYGNQILYESAVKILCLQNESPIIKGVFMSGVTEILIAMNHATYAQTKDPDFMFKYISNAKDEEKETVSEEVMKHAHPDLKNISTRQWQLVFITRNIQISE